MSNAPNTASPDPHRPTGFALSINPVLLTCALLLIAGISFTQFGANKHQKAFPAALVTAHVQTHAQRIAQITPKAMAGQPEAFEQMRQSITEVNQGLMVLAQGGDYLALSVAPPTPQQAALLDPAKKSWARSDKAAATILAMKTELGDLSRVGHEMPELTAEMEDLVEQIHARKIKQGARPHEIANSSHLVMLVQRMARSAREISAKGDFGPEQAFLVGKDSQVFGQIVDGFLNGSSQLRLSATRDPASREQLRKLQAIFGGYEKHARTLLRTIPKLIDAKQAEALIIAENEPLAQSLNTLHKAQMASREQSNWAFWSMLTRFF